MKKFAKVLSVAASALVFAALVGCSDSPEIGSIQIANPVVKAESIFGANKITWADVDNADGYIVYRQLVTEEEVEVTTKKGTTTEIKEVLSELKAISTVTATKSSEDYKVIDLVSSSALLKEGAKIRYTVEAYNNGTVDSRAISKTDDMIDFARGKGTVDVIIAEGNMPAKGTQLAAPTTAEVTVTTRASNGAAIVEVSPDAIDNDETVKTRLRYFATDVGVEDNIRWAYANGGWWNSTEIEFPGLYDIYTYNAWTIADNTYYDESKMVLAKEAVEVKAATSNAYYMPGFSASSSNKVVTLTWTADKNLTAANPTFSISKYIVKYTTISGASYYTIMEKVGELSAANKVVGTDGRASYTVYDKDVKVLDTDESYVYLLTAKAGDWIGRTNSNKVAYSDGVATWDNPTLSPYYLDFTKKEYDYLKEDVLDADGHKTGTTKYTGKANYIINGTVTLDKGESLKLAVAKYSKPTGYSAETALELIQTITETTSDGMSKVSFTAINKDVARLNSENNEFYEYRLYKTDKFGLTSVHSWKSYSSDWNENTNIFNIVDFSCGTVVATKDSITIPVSITYVGQNASVETAKVRIVYSYTNKDNTKTTKVLDTTGFVEDTIKGTSKEKEIKIEGLPADTTVTYSVFAVDANGVMVSYSATSYSDSTLAE